MGYNLKQSYNSIDELESKDKAISVLYGRTPDALGGQIIPVAVDSGGRITIGSGITLATDNIDIGDIVLKGTADVAQTPASEERLGLAIIAAGPSVGLAGQFALLTQEPRYTFTTGALNVNVASTQVTGVERFFVSEAYVTIDANANARPVEGDLDVGTFRSKSIVITNTGGNDARVTIMGSIDGGANYDVTISASTLVAAGNTLAIDESRAMSHVQIEARSDLAGNPTTVNTRGYTIGT